MPQDDKHCFECGAELQTLCVQCNPLAIFSPEETVMVPRAALRTVVNSLKRCRDEEDDWNHDREISVLEAALKI